MTFIAFEEHFSEIARSEYRCMEVFEENNFNLPSGKYLFAEMYCKDPDCDCRLVKLRELLTDKEFSCDCVAGYPGKKGELWYVRLCKPLSIDPDGPFIAMTTPYILTESTKKDWEDYLRRTLPEVKPVPGEDALHCLLKYGLSVDYWHESIWKSLAMQSLPTAIFLAGIPDIQSTLPCRWR